MNLLEWIRLILGGLCILAGLFVFVTAVIGNFKFNFVLSRMQAAALGDTMGLFLSMLGVCILAGLNAFSLKLMFIVVMFWISSPVASHLLVKMEIMTGEDLNPEKKAVKECK